MSLVDDVQAQPSVQQLVQTHLTYGAHPPLSKSIGVRSTIKRADDVDDFRAKNGIKINGELRVVVADQKPNRGLTLLKVPDHLACLLRDPSIVRICRAPGEMDATCPNLDKNEHVQRLKKQGFDGEKVTRHQLILVMRHRVPPAR